MFSFLPAPLPPLAPADENYLIVALIAERTKRDASYQLTIAIPLHDLRAAPVISRRSGVTYSRVPSNEAAESSSLPRSDVQPAQPPCPACSKATLTCKWLTEVIRCSTTTDLVNRSGESHEPQACCSQFFPCVLPAK